MTHLTALGKITDALKLLTVKFHITCIAEASGDPSKLRVNSGHTLITMKCEWMLCIQISSLESA